MEKVLVTGASGYIALHCITELLKNGYAVKGSLRSMNRENEVREAVRKEVSDNNLEICELDLLNDDGWDSAASECEYMLHLASPFIDHLLHRQISRQWFAKVEMNAAFIARDTPGNGGHVLKLRLDVLFAGGKFGCLQRVTGIDLIGDHQWDNVEV